MLEAEGVSFERGALTLLGRAAAGSMRDALSLTDQAIAYSAGQVDESAVRDMLGALDQTYLLRILDALADGDGRALMAIVDEIAARSLSFGAALTELGALLHRVARIQTVDPGPDAADDADEAHLRTLATRLSPEDVQLYYQIAAHGRRDLPLAPDETTGFSMALLRMLAFRADDATAAEAPASSRPARPARVDAARAVGTTPPPSVATTRAAAPAAGSPSARPDAASLRPDPDEAAPRRPDAAPLRPDPDAAPPKRTGAAASARPDADAATAPDARAATGTSPDADAPAPSRSSAPLAVDDWNAVVAQLRLTGLTRELVQQSELVSHDERSLVLRVPIKSLLSSAAQMEKLKAALARHFGRPVGVTIEVGAVTGTTVASTKSDARAARQADAEAIIEADPFVRAVVRDFGGAAVVPGSVKPV